jgi:BRCT domain type II-containing protein
LKVDKEVKEDEDDDDTITGPKDVKSNTLEGLQFVVSGVFENISRESLEQFIVDKGGRKMSGVSGKTSFLLIGHKMEDNREVTEGGKYRKAK